MKTLARGFTLIELIMVIVILGILAAAAVPRFVDLDSNARLSAVRAMQASLTTGATLTRGKAVIEGVNVTAANVFVDLDGDGTNEALAFGYPDSTDLHTMEWIIDGLGEFSYAGGRYSLSGTTDCYVQYTNATLGNAPTITIQTTGC